MLLAFFRAQCESNLNLGCQKTTAITGNRGPSAPHLLKYTLNTITQRLSFAGSVPAPIDCQCVSQNLGNLTCSGIYVYCIGPSSPGGNRDWREVSQGHRRVASSTLGHSRQLRPPRCRATRVS
jgi:hypothetical protein